MNLIIRDKDFKNSIALSPSRIDTFLNCSMLYAAKYIHKLPDSGNDGSKRGSVTHDILDILNNKRHLKIINAVLKEKTCKNTKSLWTLINKFAKKYEVEGSSNLDQIDQFIYVALKTDFFGPQNTVEVFSEKDFDFEVESGDLINYRLRGFIDRSFVYKRGKNLYVKITDFKTSKEKFKNDKKDINHQAICYQLACIRYVFPKYELENFDFIFLKFKDNPILSVDLKNDNFLLGYEIWLSNLQKQINEFDVGNQNDNFASLKDDLKWLCGKEGTKEDGTPKWICSCRRPISFFVQKDEKGKILKSSFEKTKECDSKESYFGCQYFYDKKGKKRSIPLSS